MYRAYLQEDTEEQDTKHKCEIFNCLRRGGKYCCFYCSNKGRCTNPCLNNPERCGKIIDSKTK